MGTTVVIQIPNFSKWQKPIQGRRDWFALDANFFYDSGVRTARRECEDSPECFIALWREADEEGNISITLPALKAYWKEILCAESNRFDPLKRLQSLSNAGLITFQLLSNDVLNESQRVLEQAETRVAVSKNKTNKTTQDNPPKPPQGESEAFKNFWTAYPKKTTKSETREYWRTHKLDSLAADIMEGLEAWKIHDQWKKENGAFIPDPIRFLRKERWKDEIAQPKQESVHDVQWARLLKYPKVRCVVNNEIIPTDQLEPIMGRPSERLYGNAAMGWQILEGVEA